MNAPPLRDVVGRLVDDGLAEPGVGERLADEIDAIDADPRRGGTPWYGRALMGGAAWLSAALAMGAITALTTIPDAAYAPLGLVLCGLATGLRHLKIPVVADFWDQLALVGVLTGRLLVWDGAWTISDSEHVVAAAMIALETALLVVYPDRVQRVVSTVAAGLWSVKLVHDVRFAPELVVGAASVGLVVAWLGRRRLHTTPLAAAQAPIGYGLAAFVLLSQLRAFVWRVEAPDTGVAAAAFTLLTLVVAALVLRDVHEAPADWLPHGPIALLAVAGLGALTWSVPGLMAAALVGILAFRSRDAVLLGLAVAFLAVFGVWFYYRLHLPFQAKAAVLSAGGGVVIALGAYAGRLGGR